MISNESDDRPSMLALLGVTLAGGLLRFAWLGRPCLWGDEALVYWRTCGSYGDLLQPLHADGFPPLHYELFWVIVHALGRTPGPAVMRSVAAVCGTLLVPAVYFLARQLLARRASLVAAAFTAGSAFALFYSRDAKMYAEAWLAMTVGVGCLLWWLRTGRSTAWLGWVAAGAAAGGLQTLALVSVIGLAPMLLLTQRRAHWRQTLLCLAGIALIVAGPVGYYARFNSWAENVNDRGWSASGIAWVQWLNFGRTGPDQARYLATTFLTGWEWPRSGPVERIPLGRLRLLEVATATACAAVLAGLLPWRTVATLVGPCPPDERTPEPPWRATLWLTAWVALPVYGFYCRSVVDYAPPFSNLGIDDHPWIWGFAVAGAMVALAIGMVFARTRLLAVRGLQLALMFAALTGACQGMAIVMAAAARAAAADGHPWQSVWVPRYLGFVWPAVAILVGVLVDRIPTWPARSAVLGLVLATNLGMFGFRLFGQTEPPVDLMAADVWAAQPRDGGTNPSTVTWLRIVDGSWMQAGPGLGNLLSDPGRYYLQVLANRPMSPTLFKQSLETFTISRGGDLVRGVQRAAGTAARVVVWEQFRDPPTDEDRLLVRWPEWQRTDDTLYPVRDVWTGQDRAFYRRREYRRSPATLP